MSNFGSPPGVRYRMRSSQPSNGKSALPARGQRAVAFLVLFALFAGFLAHHGMAADNGKTIMLGETLSDAERTELLDYFKAGSNDRVEIVTVDDTQKAMTGIIDKVPNTAYSSTALTCRDLGDGLEVKTRNITLITPSLYAMALVTAGIGDGELLVAAPDLAAAQGMTALTGVFKTWDISPCDSGSTTKSRQRLALEELALAVAIGQSLNRADGVVAAGNLVLYTQQAVVIDGLSKPDEIEDAVREQELKNSVTLTDDQRNSVVDFMVKVAKEDIDWSTFSAGWTIKPTDDGTGISMKGDGIAIRNAQATATVRAAENMTATANAAAEMSATAAANSAMLTATANAKSQDQAAANAQATQDALSAAMTATANAQPTPSPTSTPAPVGIIGKITNITGSQISVRATGSQEAAIYSVAGDASILRDGEITNLGSIKVGDKVSLTVDGTTQTVSQITATAPATAGPMASFGKLLFLLPALAVIPVILFLKNRAGGVGDTFIVKRVASA
jgi:uncharacterized protein YpuA (DUF1002 family)